MKRLKIFTACVTMLSALMTTMPVNASTLNNASSVKTVLNDVQGGYIAKGIISGAGSIHMYINTETDAFWYYYDKMGSHNKLYLTVSEYDEYSGHLVLVEENKYGDITGIFNGYLKSNGWYTGTFTNYKGKKFHFSVK